METHDERKTAKMCDQGGSGNTLQRENSNNVYPRLKWRHITKEKTLRHIYRIIQKECASD